PFKCVENPVGRDFVASFTAVRANVAFVTAADFNGALGGLDGGDARCQQAAAAAGLPGNYFAWLSTQSVNAADRFADSRGWIRVDGRPWVDSLAALTGSLETFYPLDVTEAGGTSIKNVWTGT